MPLTLLSPEELWTKFLGNFNEQNICVKVVAYAVIIFFVLSLNFSADEYKGGFAGLTFLLVITLLLVLRISQRNPRFCRSAREKAIDDTMSESESSDPNQEDT